MKKLLIYGAGAIGRGYLPRVFSNDEFEYYFVETNAGIREKLNESFSYTSYMTIDGKYDVKTIYIKKCFNLGEEDYMISQVDAILIAVGPRNFLSLSNKFIDTKLPIISFENDSTLPSLMRKATNNPNVVFAIPDVITSSSAPKELLDKDPLSIVTENGVCFVDELVASLGGSCNYVSTDELQKQWLAKLYIHNTPHCITAYFGSILKVNYLHEAMENSAVAKIIEGVMLEMEQMIFKKYHVDINFLKYYSNKELQRFSNVLLFDPISRVAREPFRKLAPNDRLIGAAELCLCAGIIPENLLIGIMSAFCFENASDPDFHIKHLMNALAPEEFLRIIIRLRKDEALYEILIQRWAKNLNIINTIKNG